MVWKSAEELLLGYRVLQGHGVMTGVKVQHTSLTLILKGVPSSGEVSREQVRVWVGIRRQRLAESSEQSDGQTPSEETRTVTDLGVLLCELVFDV